MMKGPLQFLERVLSRSRMSTGNLVDVAPAHAVQENHLLPVKCAGVSLLLTRLDGTVHACADKCPHLGRPLHGGQIYKGVITCPWHGARLNLRTGALPMLEILEENGRVFVRVPG